MEFDHDAEKVTKGVVGHKMDDDKVKRHLKDLSNPKKCFGGTKKTQVMEYIHEAKDDPEKLLALSIVLIHGLEAVALMEGIQKKAMKEMKGMEIHPDMPEELKEMIRKANGGSESVGNAAAKVEDVDDEFEKLRRKYQ